MITDPVDQVTLTASAGAPLDLSQVRYFWEQTEGPAPSTISDSQSASTIAQFSQPGYYVFRAFATDGDLTVSDEMSVHVLTLTTGGALPVVDAGSSRHVWLPSATLPLQGTVWNDPGTTTLLWSKVQGPGTATFSQAGALSGTVTFSAAGIYRLQLQATANNGSQTDELVVQVHEQSNTMGGFTELERSTYFTHDLGFEYDFEGYQWNRFSPPGPAGEHPRILFGPTDIPDINNRLANTEFGQALKTKITDDVTAKLTGTGATYRAAYDDLQAGNLTAYDAIATDQGRDTMIAMMTYEAFFALLENDTARGTKVGDALGTLAVRIKSDLVAARAANGAGLLDYRVVFQGLVHRQFFGYAYDFAYGFMSTSERDAMRSLLSEATTGIWSIGMDTAPVQNANTSNWVPTHLMHSLVNTLAIEGEVGYDADLYPRIVAALERYYRIGLGKDGTTYEGLGKNSITAEVLLALAKRGNHLLATRSVKNHIRSHYFHTMAPTGAGFIHDGLIGGNFLESRAIDVPVLKYAFPNDPVIDFVYRNDLLSSNSASARATKVYPRIADFNTRFPYKSMDFLVRAITAQDVTGPTPGDLWDDWDTALASIAPSQPTTFFSNFKGVMVARNDWNSSSAKLYFKNSTVAGGGHNCGDANTFLFSAGGIDWMTKSGQEPGSYHSIIQVEGLDPGQGESQMISYENETGGTFALGDANWLYNPATRSTAYSPNDRHLFPYEDAWMAAPFSENIYAHWELGHRSNEVLPTTSITGIARARRLAGLVRGPQPYAVIADDIVSATGAKSFSWQMTLPLDLGGNVTINGDEAIVAATTGNERLLVKLVAASGPTGFTLDNYPSGTPSLSRLRVVLSSIAPKYRVILYPHQSGDTLPTFSYDTASDTITMTQGANSDTIQFTSDSSGVLSGLAVLRNGTKHFDLRKNFAPPTPTSYQTWKDFHGLMAYSDVDWLPEANMPVLSAYALGALDALPNPAYVFEPTGTGLIMDFSQPEPPDVTRSLEWSEDLFNWRQDNIAITAQGLEVTGFLGDRLFVRIGASLLANSGIPADTPATPGVIVWRNPDNTIEATEILGSDGTLEYSAVNLSSLSDYSVDTGIETVAFNSLRLTGLSNYENPGVWTGNTGDANFDAVLRSMHWSSSSSVDLEFDVVDGNIYEIQFFYADHRLQTRTEYFTDGMTSSGTLSTSTGGWVSCVFIASGTTQTITMQSNEDASLNAYVIRSFSNPS